MKHKNNLLLALFVALSASKANSAEFSWQEKHAEVLPNGDLQLAQRPFVFEAGKTIRYIDYKNGLDANTGASKDSAWKHHPWDKNAQGVAKSAKNIDTYIFKRGVKYRGVLISKESGTKENPIRLTSDPSWGEGSASFCGSTEIKGGWSKGGAPDGMPDPDKVWSVNLNLKRSQVECLWEEIDGKVNRIPLAREPNWTITNPDSIMEGWWDFTGDGNFGGKVVVKSSGRKKRVGGTRVAQDKIHLTSKDPNYYKGGRLWTTYDGNMGTPRLYSINHFISPKGHFRGVKYHPEHSGFQGLKNPQQRFAVAGAFKGSKYFLENLPVFLDVPGEYYYKTNPDKKSGKLYLRLPDDRNPNKSIIEVGKVPHMINIINNSNIIISGLNFNYNNPVLRIIQWPTGKSHASAVRIVGNCQDVTVKNCDFKYVMAGITGYPRLSGGLYKAYSKRNDIIPEPKNGKADIWEDVTISDNNFSDVDGISVYITDPYMTANYLKDGLGEVGRLNILRNSFYFVGHRQYSSEYAPVAAIGIRAATVGEIAGNIVDRSGGPGIWSYVGKSKGSAKSSPLLRMLIHHNKVMNTCLLTNDWGGIETWYGGPTYVYNNISYNAVGPRYAIFYNNRVSKSKRMYGAWACNSYAFYLDHGYKNYLFNNIGLGKSNDNTKDIRNRSGSVMVHGFLNHWFNNTFDNFLHGMTGSSGEYNYVLSNLYSRTTSSAISQNSAGDLSLAGGGITGGAHESPMSTLAFKNNIASKCRYFGLPSVKDENGKRVKYKTIAGATEYLNERYNPIDMTFGKSVKEEVLDRTELFNVRPKNGAAVKDKGTRFFVPWSLYSTVGEWNFRLFPKDPTRILGENYNMTDEYINAKKFDEIPRNHLTAPNATIENYTISEMDDWVPSTMIFDGKKQFATVSHKDMYADYPVAGKFIDGLKNKIGVQNSKWSGTKTQQKYPGKKRLTVNMDTNSFILEAYLKTGDTGTIISKTDSENGYSLSVNNSGKVELILKSSGQTIGAIGGQVNDNKWHHILAEIDRTAGSLNIFIDGKKSVSKNATLSSNASLSNKSDFFVGKGEGGAFFTGEIDFLRVARGSLKDSMTSIEELYEWQFKGPQYSDFTGKEIKDGKRDAGAIEIQ